ncbi:hypothetical protein [Pseudomonas guariconensis]|uniref:hypothetical protein n=1 Tax=Pseudomonas guariconensis TaxID=1288410 RepID=UPI0018D8324B|nr:hypothetical protein [Pseudomonas guariconensis]MBH3361174.1 hypothetical protein [Pseudomonas guariconensis]
MTRLALCLLLLATLAGCEMPDAQKAAAMSPTDSTSNERFEVTRIGTAFIILDDKAKGSTCYALNGVGISCIPDTQLQAGNECQLSPHETQPEPTPAMAPGRWIDERYQL